MTAAVGAIQYVTVGVSNLAESLRLFQDGMALRLEHQGELGEEHLALWGLANHGACYAELSARRYPVGRLRLVQFDPPAQTYVRRTGQSDRDGPCDVGPKAIDFYVADPIANAVARIEQLGYAFRSPPQRHLLGETDSEECVFYGPDGVPILLMVGHNHRPESLRAGSPEGPFSEIATISIVVRDLERSRQFYQEHLGLVAGTDAETPEEFRDLVCRLTDAPPGSRVHFLMMAQPGEPSGKILLLYFFDATGKPLIGRMRPGHLGFSLLTHPCKSVDALAETLGDHVISGPSNIHYADKAQRAILVAGPNDEAFEFTSDQ